MYIKWEPIPSGKLRCGRLGVGLEHSEKAGESGGGVQTGVEVLPAARTVSGAAVARQSFCNLLCWRICASGTDGYIFVGNLLQDMVFQWTPAKRHKGHVEIFDMPFALVMCQLPDIWIYCLPWMYAVLVRLSPRLQGGYGQYILYPLRFWFYMIASKLGIFQSKCKIKRTHLWRFTKNRQKHWNKEQLTFQYTCLII